jgi:hypothetical protein
VTSPTDRLIRVVAREIYDKWEQAGEVPSRPEQALVRQVAKRLLLKEDRVRQTIKGFDYTSR